MTRPYHCYLFGILLLLSLGTIAKPLQWYLIKNLIDVIAGNSTHDIYQICLLYSILKLVVVITWTLVDYYSISYTSSFRLDIAHYFMDRLYDGTYNFFQNQLVGNLSSKVNDAFQQLPHLIFIMLEVFTQLFILIVVSTALLIPVAPRFAIAMLFWVCSFFSLTLFSLKKGKHVNERYASEKANLMGVVTDYLSNIVSVKAFTAKQFEFKQFSRLRQPFLTAARRQGMYFMWFYTLQGILSTSYSIGLIALLVVGYKKGHIGPGDFALVIMTNIIIIDLAYQVSHTLREFMASWGLVDQAITLAEEIPQLVAAKQKKLILQSKGGGIRFDAVSFRYRRTVPLFQTSPLLLLLAKKLA